MRLKVTRSTGNVFRDLGFSVEEAEHLRIRSDLLIELQKTIGKRRLKQAEAARLLGVTQPRVSDLMRGRIDLFSTDTLIDKSPPPPAAGRSWALSPYHSSRSSSLTPRPARKLRLAASIRARNRGSCSSR